MGIVVGASNAELGFKTIGRITRTPRRFEVGGADEERQTLQGGTGTVKQSYVQGAVLALIVVVVAITRPQFKKWSHGTIQARIAETNLRGKIRLQISPLVDVERD